MSKININIQKIINQVLKELNIDLYQLNEMPSHEIAQLRTLLKKKTIQKAGPIKDPTILKRVEEVIDQIISKYCIDLDKLNKEDTYEIYRLFILMEKKIAQKIGSIIKDEEVVKDLKQDLFAKFLEKFPLPKPKQQYVSVKQAINYILVAAKNIAVDELRRSQRNKEELRDYSEMDVSVPEEEQPDMVQWLVYQNCLEHLPEPDKTVLQLRVEGKNNTEIAEIVGVCVKTVRNIRARIKKHVRNLPGAPN